MKKVALTVAVLALGLAACGSKTENAVDNTAVENVAEADLNAAIDNSADVATALDNAGNAVENVGNAAENVGNAVANEAK